jgi:hypothetical protein
MLPIQVITVFLVAVAMALALAHALEYPGTMRLNRENYIVTQSIYYPGFTIGGFGEALGVIASLTLMLLMPRGSAPFWWSLVGFISLALMQVVFWTVTQPVNRHWTANLNLSSSARHFFRVEQRQSGSAELPQGGQWERLRNRWEYSQLSERCSQQLVWSASRSRSCCTDKAEHPDGNSDPPGNQGMTTAPLCRELRKTGYLDNPVRQDLFRDRPRACRRAASALAGSVAIRRRGSSGERLETSRPERCSVGGDLVTSRILFLDAISCHDDAESADLSQFRGGHSTCSVSCYARRRFAASEDGRSPLSLEDS